MGAFGEKLRKQREQRGLELDAISNTTKISPRMLRALEDEHFDQLPGGVFNKGFVRAYARQVGLNEDEAVSEYLVALRESQIQQQAILPDFRSPASAPRKPAGPAPVPNVDHAAHNKNVVDSPRHEEVSRKNAPREKVSPPVPINERDNNGHLPDNPRPLKPHLPVSPQPEPFAPATRDEPRSHAGPEIFPTQGFITGPASAASVSERPPVPWKPFTAAAFVIIVLFAFWNLRRHSEAKIAAQLPPPVSTPQQTAPPAPFSTPPPAPPTSQPVVASAPAPASKTSAPPVAATSTTTFKPAAILSSPPKKLTPVPKPAVSSAGKPAPATSVPPVLTTKTRSAAAKPPATFTLLIRAEKTTWVSIVADGKPVAEETLIAPAHTSVRASHEIYVRAGNAAGVSFIFNGKEVPAHGPEGVVKAFVFDAAGLHASP